MKNNEETGMEVWFRDPAKVSDALRGQEIDYSYQDNSGNLVIKGDTGAGVERNSIIGGTWGYTANELKARTKAGTTNSQGNVFALSVSEVNYYASAAGGSALNKKAYDATATGTECNWWMRSPGDVSTPASFVYTNGYVTNNDATRTTMGFRAALWIHL